MSSGSVCSRLRVRSTAIVRVASVGFAGRAAGVSVTGRSLETDGSGPPGNSCSSRSGRSGVCTLSLTCRAPTSLAPGDCGEIENHFFQQIEELLPVGLGPALHGPRGGELLLERVACLGDGVALERGVDTEPRHQHECHQGGGTDGRALDVLRALALVEEADDRGIVAAVALRPGRVRLGFGAPGDEVRELAAAQHLAGAEAVDQPAPLLRRAAFGAEPFRQLLPLPDQALVADVDVGVERELRIVRIELGQQES